MTPPSLESLKDTVVRCKLKTAQSGGKIVIFYLTFPLKLFGINFLQAVLLKKLLKIFGKQFPTETVIVTTKQIVSQGALTNNENFHQVPKETGVINIIGTTLGKRTTRNKEELLLREQ